MRPSRRSRAVLAGACTTAALALTTATPATAAPYVPDALLFISTTNPLIGGTLSITVLNYDTGELIEIRITGSSQPLTTARADENGALRTPVTLPAGLLCQHTLTATGRESGKVARTDLLIGSLLNCNPAGKVITKTADEVSGAATGGLVKQATSGIAKQDTGGLVRHGTTGLGQVNYSSAAPPDDRRAPAAGVAAVLGLATVGGIVVARQRRQD